MWLGAELPGETRGWRTALQRIGTDLSAHSLKLCDRSVFDVFDLFQRVGVACIEFWAEAANCIS